MGINPYANCNDKIPDYQCTFDTCCLAQSSFLYRPDFAGNLFFCIYFGVFIIPQLGLSIYYKTWGFGVGMSMGLVLEVVGYGGRIMLHNNPWNDNAFLIYLICLTIAPVFISGAIYLCITRIIVLYGENNSRVQPRTVAITFMCSDFLSLVLQAVGGAIADTAATNVKAQPGVNTMIAGLLLQAVSLGFFILFFADFSWRCHKGELDMDPQKQRVRQSAFFKLFRASILLATLVILIRSIFRVAELWGGFAGNLWNNQTDFMVLDGGMISLAAICLTAVHPGPAFGGLWSAADWTFRTKKNGNVKREKRGHQSDDSQY